MAQFFNLQHPLSIYQSCTGEEKRREKNRSDGMIEAAVKTMAPLSSEISDFKIDNSLKRKNSELQQEMADKKASCVRKNVPDKKRARKIAEPTPKTNEKINNQIIGDLNVAIPHILNETPKLVSSQNLYRSKYQKNLSNKESKFGLKSCTCTVEKKSPTINEKGAASKNRYSNTGTTNMKVILDSTCRAIKSADISLTPKTGEKRKKRPRNKNKLPQSFKIEVERLGHEKLPETPSPTCNNQSSKKILKKLPVPSNSQKQAQVKARKLNRPSASTKIAEKANPQETVRQAKSIDKPFAINLSNMIKDSPPTLNDKALSSEGSTKWKKKRLRLKMKRMMRKKNQTCPAESGKTEENLIPKSNEKEDKNILGMDGIEAEELKLSHS
ncbi:hypothetical protein K3495_g2668 [Podosphaera aphanis]|nr:hypothetical protein K3495_g2668 [Podosphaera aphanis]